MSVATLTVKIIDATDLPPSISINQQFNFSVTGQVEWTWSGRVGSYDSNPAVGLNYYDGPSNYIFIVTQNNIVQLNKGTTVYTSLPGVQTPGTTITLQAGAILPAPGTYTLQFVAGFLDNSLIVTDHRTYTVDAIFVNPSPSPSPGAPNPSSAPGLPTAPGLPSAPSLPSWAPFAIVLTVVGGAAVAVASLMYNQQQKLYQALAKR